MDDTRVRDALNDVANEAPEAVALWQRTQHRITQRHRRRIGIAALAIVAVITIGAGTLAAVMSNNDDNRITAGPTRDAPSEILAAVGGDLTVLSTSNGAALRRIPIATSPYPVHVNVLEVSTSIGAARIVFTQPSEPQRECVPAGASLSEANSDGSHPVTLVGAGVERPVMSPDGRWVAYGISECGFVGSDVGVTELTSHQNWRMTPSFNSDATATWVPLAWTPDSTRLLTMNGEGAFALSSVPDGKILSAVKLPQGTKAASFVSGEEVLIAYPNANGTGDVLALRNLRTGHTRSVPALSNATFSSLSFDQASETLLIVGTRSVWVGTLSDEGFLLHLDDGVAEITSAALYAPPVSTEPSVLASPGVRTADVMAQDAKVGKVAISRRGDVVLYDLHLAGDSVPAGKDVGVWLVTNDGPRRIGSITGPEIQSFGTTVNGDVSAIDGISLSLEDVGSAPTTPGPIIATANF